MLLKAGIQSTNQPDAKIHIAFLLFTDLRTGAGTENVVLNYVKNSDFTNVDICVVETDWLYDGVYRRSESEIDSYLKNSKRIRIHSYTRPFNFMTKCEPTNFFLQIILNPILYRIIGRVIYRKLFNDLSLLDAVILMDNNYALCFPKHSKKHKAEIVATNHCFKPDRSVLRLLEVYPLSWWHKIQSIHLFQNYTVCEDILTTKKMFILPNGVDSSLFQYGTKSEGKIKILFAARLTKGKGTLRAIDIWKRAKSKDKAELHIAGGGPLQNTVANQVGDGLIYHGVLPEDELASLYQSCDMFLYPSTEDTFSLAVIQALSTGMYCMIGSSFRGIYDEYVSRGWAEYIEPYDIDAISKRIDEVVSCWADRTNERKACHCFTYQQFDWGSITSRLYRTLSILS